MIIVFIMKPSRWHPLGFSLQQVNFFQKLLICSVWITVNDDHVKVMTISLLTLMIIVFIMKPSR